MLGEKLRDLDAVEIVTKPCGRLEEGGSWEKS